MKSKTSSFNRTLITSLWKRFWPLYMAYFAIWVIVLPLQLGNRLAWNLRNLATNSTAAAERYATVGQLILNDGISGGTIMSIFFCILVAMAVYSYLYNARSVSMMCALPIKREKVFLSQFIAGLSMMLLINVAVFLITLAVGSAYGSEAGFDSAYLWQWLGIVCLENVFFFGFASLCASFTGNIIVLPLVYFVLNFTVWGVKEMIAAIMSLFSYGYAGNSSSVADCFSPAVRIMDSNGLDAVTMSDSAAAVVSGYTFKHWGMLLIYAAVGIVFALLAMCFVKRRRMESAGDVVALRPLKPIFKYCMTGGAALVMGLLLYSSSGLSSATVKDFSIMICYMLIGAFIGYFASEMMMQKTLRVFGAKWLGFGISCAAIAVLMFCLRCDVFGYEKYVPEASEIESVYLGGGTVNSNLADPENISSVLELHKSLIDHKSSYVNAQTQSSAWSYNLRIDYVMKDGKLVRRDYEITESAHTNDIEKLQELANSKEAVLSRKKLDYPVTPATILAGQINYFDKATKQYVTIQIPSDQMYELYTNCIKADISELTLGRVWYITDDSYLNRVFDCTINFDVQQKAEKQRKDENTRYYGQNFSTTLTLDAERTYQWIEDHYHLDLTTMGESKKLQGESVKIGEPDIYQNGTTTSATNMTVMADAAVTPQPSSEPHLTGDTEAIG